MIYFVTQRFPYAKGESYIELESQFHPVDKTRFVPVETKGEAKGEITREIDHEIESGFIDASKLKQDMPGTLILVIRSLFRFHVVNEIVRHPSVLFSYHKLRSLILFSFYSEQSYQYFQSLILQSPDEPKIFYSYWYNAWVHGLSRLKRRYPHIRIVCRAHGGDLYKERYPKNYLPYGKRYHQEIDQIYPVSNQGRDYLIREYAIPANKVSVARLGVAKPDTRPDFPDNPDVISILSVSQIIPLKRIDLICEAVAWVQDNTDFQIQWTHIGEGPEKQKILDLAQSLNVKPNFTGQMKNQDVMNYYLTTPVDMLVNASEFEGLPVSMMEALSYNIPIIGTDVGGVNEIVTEDTGLLLNEYPSVEQLGKAIVNLKQNKNSYSNKLRIFFELNYNGEKNYRKFIHKLNQLESRSKPES